MNFLLDTCVLSETIKPKPDASLVQWLRDQEPDSLFLCAISLGELRKGIDRLAPGKKRHDLSLWLVSLVGEFGGRFLDFDTETAMTWGSLSANLETAGTPMPVIDAMIAACALRHGHILVTRNEGDYRHSGVALINPWTV
jgi:predicted nucleic acid-binding protein